jgi:hypothetical protein
MNITRAKKLNNKTDTFIWKLTVLVTTRLDIKKGNVEYVFP